MDFITFIHDAPLWLTIPLGITYLAQWVAFIVFVVKLWHKDK